MTIYCLVGHSASGKSTIEKEIEQKDITRIVSYTTRPKRDGEVDGVHYHYLTEQEFVQYDKQGRFTETAKYRDWYYALSLEGLDYKNKPYVAVVTPSGYDNIINKIGEEHVVAFFIDVPERERMSRLLKRGDDVDEIMRRIQADRKDFEGFSNKADFIIQNSDVDKAVNDVYACIRCLNK